MLGRISAIRLIVSALAPVLFSVLMAHGTSSALSVAIVLGIGAAVAFANIGWVRRGTRTCDGDC